MKIRAAELYLQTLENLGLMRKYDLVLVDKMIQIQLDDFFDFQGFLLNDPVLAVRLVDQLHVDLRAFAKFLEFDLAQVELALVILVACLHDSFLLDEIDEVVLYFLIYLGQSSMN